VSVLAKLVLAAATATAATAGAFHATLVAPGHTPKVNTHWNYVVRASRDGKPVAARLTAQIVDPIGGSHPVEYAATKKPITNWPFKGTFRDYVIWPRSTRGIPLTFRLVVRSGGATKVIRYAVTPKG
jgi:hypothetical protein